MSPKAGINEQNFDLTKHHLMKSPNRKKKISSKDSHLEG